MIQPCSKVGILARRINEESAARIIKELRLAPPLSHHDGNTLLAHLPSLGNFFLSTQADLGNTPFRFDPFFPCLHVGFLSGL